MVVLLKIIALAPYCNRLGKSQSVWPMEMQVKMEFNEIRIDHGGAFLGRKYFLHPSFIDMNNLQDEFSRICKLHWWQNYEFSNSKKLIWKISSSAKGKS